MEQYKLNLVKEAKKAITDITSSASSPRMDCTKNLRLLPKFDEKDQDTFFFYYVSLPLATLFEEEAQVSEYMG